MSKCENCIHFDVCANQSRMWEDEGYRTDFNTRDDAENICVLYKDKSLCVDIPCKVGETVYEIRNSKIFNEKTVEMRVIAITFLVSSCCKHLSITAENSRGANLLFELDDFGKTVFLDQAEAERKLREVGE